MNWRARMERWEGSLLARAAVGFCFCIRSRKRRCGKRCAAQDCGKCGWDLILVAPRSWCIPRRGRESLRGDAEFAEERGGRIEVLPVAILAGGLATRLRPATEKIPKSLLEVNGEPFIAHQLRLLKAGGVSQVVLCVGFLGEMVRDVVKNGHAFGLDVHYSFDGPALLGTAGALKRALPALGKAFLTLYGDSYLLCDYAGVAREFEASGKQALMTVFLNERHSQTCSGQFECLGRLAYNYRSRRPG